MKNIIYRWNSILQIRKLKLLSARLLPFIRLERRNLYNHFIMKFVEMILKFKHNIAVTWISVSYVVESVWPRIEGIGY